ncbi:cation:proton antiporter, partial [candidate division GN15 bacterium]
MTDLKSIFEYVRSNEIGYILLIFVIFIVPKALQRYRLPAAITAFGLGAGGALLLNYTHADSTIKLLATLGIVTLFLHAGLDINIAELHRNRRVLTQHIAMFLGLLALVSAGLHLFSAMSLRLCVLVSLALVTPSTGFIIDSIKSFGLSAEEKEWVRAKAIATELVALAVMFFTLQSLTLETFLISIATILALVVVIPFLFKFFATRIAPFAPNSEFAFLIMLATACAFITRKIGAYYLVGAFVVGIAARRFQEQIPSVTSERLIGAVELFASFFVPFYFFYSGTVLSKEDFTSSALLLGFAMVMVILPLRVLVVILHRRIVLRESFRQGARVGLPMLPTLVFTLVLAQLMREQFEPSAALYGGLVIYALFNSLVVSLIFKSQQPDYSADMLEDGLEKLKRS